MLAPFRTSAVEAYHTLAKVLRSRLHESQPSWADVRRLIETRRVTVNGTLCTDEARRLHEGDEVVLLAQSAHRPKASTPAGLVVRHLDESIIVVEKASGLNTVRHPKELEWSERRRELVPTLQDVALWAIEQQRPGGGTLPPLRIVHRLDKETSGLLVFARTPQAERDLGLQFRQHTVVRRYLALVPGVPKPQTISNFLVRDRGDGRRGSTPLSNMGKRAVTHIEIEEQLKGYTLLSCRLETGRTHQIRIHLSEAGHPICGDKVYCKRANGDEFEDRSGAPRLALHATELGFVHPFTNAKLHWTMPLPNDLQKLVTRLRG